MEDMPDGESGAHHTCDYDQSRYHGGAPGIKELLEAELETEREEENDDTYLSPEVDVFLGSDGGKILEMWAREKTRDDVAEDDRLFNPLEQNGYDPPRRRMNARSVIRLSVFMSRKSC